MKPHTADAVARGWGVGSRDGRREGYCGEVWGVMGSSTGSESEGQSIRDARVFSKRAVCPLNTLACYSNEQTLHVDMGRWRGSADKCEVRGAGAGAAERGVGARMDLVVAVPR